MHFHPLLHYHAFGARDTFMCITVHIDAFKCMHMRCILMHSNYDAFMCITVCMHSERDAFTRIAMYTNELHSNAF